MHPIVDNALLIHQCLQTLERMDSLYKFCDQWFFQEFSVLGADGELPAIVEKKVVLFNELFVKRVYRKISSQLFEEHRLLFAFLLASSVMKGSQELAQEEWDFFVTSQYTHVEDIRNQLEGVPDEGWRRINPLLTRLDSMKQFAGIRQHFCHNHREWMDLKAVPCPQILSKLPQKYQALSLFQKLILVKVFFPEKVLPCVEYFVQQVLGADFMKQKEVTLKEVLAESTPSTPIMLIKRQGQSQAWREFEKCAKDC